MLGQDTEIHMRLGQHTYLPRSRHICVWPRHFSLSFDVVWSSFGGTEPERGVHVSSARKRQEFHFDVQLVIAPHLD